MIKKIYLSIILLTTMAFGSAKLDLTNEQIQKIQDVYDIGKKIKARNGISFEKTLVGIMAQESSWGIANIGDNYENGKPKSLYMSSLGNFQIKLSTAKLTIRQYPHLMQKYSHLLYDGHSIYLEYEKNKAKLDYIKSELIKAIKNDQRVLATSTQNSKIRKLSAEYATLMKTHNQLSAKAEKDIQLMDKLLNDHKFGAELAGYYLVFLYDDMLNKGWSQPYLRSIGRYNGGLYNWDYANKVMYKIDKFSALLKKGYIS